MIADRPGDIAGISIHALCEQNYKPAGIRFGVILGTEEQRNAD
jgi:hypothetical protein